MVKLPYVALGDKVRRKNLTEEGDEDNEQFNNTEVWRDGGVHVVNRRELVQEEGR